MLVTARIYLFIPFYSNLTLSIVLKSVRCWRQYPVINNPITSVVDCQPAIDMLPNGLAIVDRIRQKPLNPHLPPIARKKCFLPTIFCSGNCLSILTEHDRKASYPRIKAASAMYFKVWLEVRMATGTIL